MSYAFTFDAWACSGCKACQEACKDKNQLPAGLLWRRVIEVSGGGWQQVGSAWENNIFAYNLSLACSHCTHPKCAGVCPTSAYSVRPDGIVIIDPTKCMGCGYCAWACPYGMPQFDTRQGIMTKCDFCHDAIDAGLPPSCVAACPLRVLEFGTLETLEAREQELRLWQLPGSEHPFPLPGFSRTEPHLAVTPHPGMATPISKLVSNQEEILPPGAYEQPVGKAAFHELPLVGFTLLVQMAAGMAAASLVTSPIPNQVLLAIGLLLGGGGLLSFWHLGHKRNAWRAVIHLKKSWLSREVLLASLFGATWAVTAGLFWLEKASPLVWPMALLGIATVYCMGQVYLLRAVAHWNSWRTPLGFFLSAVVLGALGMNLFLPGSRWVIAAGIALLAELGLTVSDQGAAKQTAGQWRIGLLLLASLGCLFTIFSPLSPIIWQGVILFVLALAVEIIGRWQFYGRRRPFPL